MMSSKRIYDIIGAIVATLVATLVINQFPRIIEFFNSGFELRVYAFSLIIILLIFATAIITKFFDKRKLEHSILEKEKEIRAKDNEILEINEKFKKLQETTSIDIQTGALNKNQIENSINSKIEAALKTDEKFCLILADIDNFKRINDTYDHEKGNFVLKQLVDLIRPRSKEDKLIRYGGDEFLIVTKLGENISGGYGYAERIRKEVQAHNFVIDYTSVNRENLTISCGVTIYHGKSDSREELLERVAGALKIAKSEREDKKKKNFVHVIE